MRLIRKLGYMPNLRESDGVIKDTREMQRRIQGAHEGLGESIEATSLGGPKAVH